MKTQSIRRTTGIVSALSILPHIFCCGIPAGMALVSLGTTLGLAGVLATNPLYRFVDDYHGLLLGVAIGSVVLSGILNFVAWRIDCHASAQSCSCNHDHCAPKKRTGLKIFLFSLVLLCLDIAWFVAEESLLGLHH